MQHNNFQPINTKKKKKKKKKEKTFWLFSIHSVLNVIIFHY